MTAPEAVPAGHSPRCRACGVHSGAPVAPHREFAAFRCGDCGTVWFEADQGHHLQRYEELYHQEVGDEQFDGSLARLRLRSMAEVPPWALPPPRLRTTDRLLIRRISEKYGSRGHVIDLGCGSGRLLQCLTALGLSGLGIEVLPALVQDLNAAGIPAVTTDGNDLPVEAVEGKPDVVVAVEVLEHLEEPLQLLHNLRDACPEAEVMVTVPSPERSAARTGSFEPWDFPPNHLIRFTPNGLASLFQRAGYDVEVVVPAATASDGTPTWWKLAPAKLVDVLRRITPNASGGHAPTETLHRRLSGRFLALLLLWAQWAHDRLGLALGTATTVLSSTRREFSADSMVAIASFRGPPVEPRAEREPERRANPR